MKTVPDRQLSSLLGAVCDDTFAARFELLEEAGEGGMGTVYRGRRVADGAAVAIKEMITQTDVDVARFTKEAEVLEQLDHRGIVSYLEHGATTDGRHYLVIAWLDGQSLRERLCHGPIVAEEAVDLAQQIAEALEHAHGAGVVHRDLKPSNLMLVDDRVVLVDFGIARRLHTTDATLTRPGQIVGTPGYFAPEQLTEGETIDGRTDVFALGCVLYEMLTGTKAFGGGAVVHALVDAVAKEPSPVDAVPRLASAVQAMIAKSPSERPTAAEVAHELADIQRGLRMQDATSLADTSPLAARLRQAKRARPRRGWAWAALFMAAAAVIAWRSWPRPPSPSVSPAASDSNPAAPCDRDRRAGCPEQCVAKNAEACWRHGDALVHGTHGYSRDRPAGLVLLRRACDEGVGRSCLTASTILRVTHKGAPPSTWVPELERLLTRGCNLDFANACRRLASEVRDGMLGSDERRARQLAEKACDLGDNHACRVVAGWYLAAEQNEQWRHALNRACHRHDEIACAALKTPR